MGDLVLLAMAALADRPSHSSGWMDGWMVGPFVVPSQHPRTHTHNRTHLRHTTHRSTLVSTHIHRAWESAATWHRMTATTTTSNCCPPPVVSLLSRQRFSRKYTWALSTRTTMTVVSPKAAYVGSHHRCPSQYHQWIGRQGTTTCPQHAW